MAKTNPDTIILTGSDLVSRFDDPAGGAITPGHLIMFSGANVVVHNDADGWAAPMFAVENDLQGDEISDAYASGGQVQYGVCPAGVQVYAWLKAGQNVAKGAALSSAGDGSLKAAAGVTSAEPEARRVVAQAMEALDNSASAAVNARIKVMVV